MTLIFRRLDHPLPVPRVIALCLAAALGLAASGGRVAAAAGKGDTKGFLITRSAQAFTYDAMEIDCPLGFELTTEEGFLATLTPAERERLLRPENAKEYGYRWREEYITGPGGENAQPSGPKQGFGGSGHGAEPIGQGAPERLELAGSLRVGDLAVKLQALILSRHVVFREGRAHTQGQFGLDSPDGPLSLHPLDRLFEQPAVEVESHSRDVARLLGPDDVARSPNFEISGGQTETSAQLAQLF